MKRYPKSKRESLKKELLARVNTTKQHGFNSSDVFCNLFNSSVQKLWEYIERDYQGKFAVVYYYKNWYIFTSGDFGSCGGCDEFAENDEPIDYNELISRFTIVDKISDITLSISDTYHKELWSSFQSFKTNKL